MTKQRARAWCGRCEYPGYDPFLFGTVVAESELEALRALQEAWARISPHPAPSFAPLQGMLIFNDELAP